MDGHGAGVGDVVDGATFEPLAPAASSPQSLVAGEATIGGCGVVVLASDFGCQGGSIGVAEGSAIAAAFDHAQRCRRPVLSIISSGGTRMQEGAPAFVQMVKIASAAARFRRHGGFAISYFSGAVFGGALASWGTLGQLLLAAPGTRVGFMGARVMRDALGVTLPQGLQCAERLRDAGLIDDIVERAQLRTVVARALRIVAPPSVPAAIRDDARAMPLVGTATQRDAWECVMRSRAFERPRANALVAALTAEAVEFHGDLLGGGDDLAVRTVLTRIAGTPVVVVAHDATAGPVSVAGLRKARRAICLARELRATLVTIIDTPGAEISAAAESQGLAYEIGRCLTDLVELPSPSVSVLLGQGAGGAAIALLPSDRVVAADDAWLSPLPPEAAAALSTGSPANAPEMARLQGIAAHALHRHGIVDDVITTEPPPGAGLVPAMAAAIAAAVTDLQSVRAGDRVDARAARFATLGYAGSSAGSGISHS
jgi:acetyl-CoA carboxylase carboxyl transferase subunit beta